MSRAKVKRLPSDAGKPQKNARSAKVPRKLNRIREERCSSWRASTLVRAGNLSPKDVIGIENGKRGLMKKLIGTTDILFLTLDTLRFDAAQQAWQDGKLDTFGPYLGERGWEK